LDACANNVGNGATFAAIHQLAAHPGLLALPPMLCAGDVLQGNRTNLLYKWYSTPVVAQRVEGLQAAHRSRMRTSTRLV
jgi:hypothetical protein